MGPCSGRACSGRACSGMEAEKNSGPAWRRARLGSGPAIQRQAACKPGSVPRTALASAAERRPFIWDADCSTPLATNPDGGSGSGSRARNAGPRHPYSVLLPTGLAMPTPLLAPRCALTAPFHPCPPGIARSRAGGLLSVALSLNRASRRGPPGVTRRRASAEPGLSSNVAQPPRPRPSGRLTRFK